MEAWKHVQRVFTFTPKYKTDARDFLKSNDVSGLRTLIREQGWHKRGKIDQVGWIADANEWTLLYGACSWSEVEMVRMLCEEFNADPNIKEEEFWCNYPTPLTIASSKGHLAIVQYLVDTCHVDIHVTNFRKETALQIAESSNNHEIANYLRERENNQENEEVPIPSQPPDLIDEKENDPFVEWFNNEFPDPWWEKCRDLCIRNGCDDPFFLMKMSMHPNRFNKMCREILGMESDGHMKLFREGCQSQWSENFDSNISTWLKEEVGLSESDANQYAEKLAFSSLGISKLSHLVSGNLSEQQLEDVLCGSGECLLKSRGHVLRIFLEMKKWCVADVMVEDGVEEVVTEPNETSRRVRHGRPPPSSNPTLGFSAM